MGKFIIGFLLSYLWHGMGITIGYHRLLSHRSFKCSKMLEYFWVFGGYFAQQGSPIWWASIHRTHHKYTDMPLDPHSPRFSLKNAWYGWFTKTSYPAHINPRVQSPDLVSDPVYRFLEQDGDWHRAHWLSAAGGLLLRLAIFELFGWQVALANVLAGVLAWQIPQMLNVVCHIERLGYKNYSRADDSVNIWWVALIAFGEGWHNNHHAFPGSARSGLQAHEVDFSWLMLRGLKALGLVEGLDEARIYDSKHKVPRDINGAAAQSAN